jgi:hypothetical protein
MQYAAAPRSWHELHDSHTPLLSALTSGYSTLRRMSLAALVLHIWRYIVLHANALQNTSLSLYVSRWLPLRVLPLHKVKRHDWLASTGSQSLTRVASIVSRQKELLIVLAMLTNMTRLRSM